MGVMGGDIYECFNFNHVKLVNLRPDVEENMTVYNYLRSVLIFGGGLLGLYSCCLFQEEGFQVGIVLHLCLNVCFQI